MRWVENPVQFGVPINRSHQCGRFHRLEPIVSKPDGSIWVRRIGCRPRDIRRYCRRRCKYTGECMDILKGKTAIVTGAASGIGRASAMLFAAEGAAVVALDRAAEVEATATAIRAAGGRAIALIKDSSNEADVAGAVATALKEFGGLDACYANAGISGGLVPFLEETVDHWMEVLKINLIGTFLLAKYAAKEMVKQQRGSIICTASVAGLRSGAGGVPYSASKAGVISLVQTVAYQLTGTGVRINAICPGLIE